MTLSRILVKKVLCNVTRGSSHHKSTVYRSRDGIWPLFLDKFTLTLMSKLHVCVIFQAFHSWSSNFRTFALLDNFPKGCSNVTWSSSVHNTTVNSSLYESWHGKFFIVQVNIYLASLSIVTLTSSRILVKKVIYNVRVFLFTSLLSTAHRPLFIYALWCFEQLFALSLKSPNHEF